MPEIEGLLRFGDQAQAPPLAPDRREKSGDRQQEGTARALPGACRKAACPITVKRRA